jgi:hypothetical protein
MTERTQCPECHGHLKDPAKCRCGWMAPQAAQAAVNPGHVPCAGDPNCRYVGRLLVEGMDQNKRLCVDHYYQALERGARHVEIEKPKRAA